MDTLFNKMAKTTRKQLQKKDDICINLLLN